MARWPTGVPIVGRIAWSSQVGSLLAGSSPNSSAAGRPITPSPTAISRKYTTPPDKSGEDEREHMIIWFESNETSGSGSYSRKTPNGSARTCYGRLCNAASLLWIAEAVGVPKATVQRAFEAAETAGDYRSACGRIRKIIPWDEILVRANLLMSKRETPTRLPRLLKLVPKWAHRKKGD